MPPAATFPSSAEAYSLNFSVVPHGGLGYLTVWPTGETRPLVSTLNDVPGTIIANAAIVPAGTGGDISVYPSNDTDLIIDINGYFAPAGPGGLSLYPSAPCRVIDTRQVGNGQPFTGTLTPPVDVVNSPCADPGHGAGVCLQRDGGAERRTGLPDAVARRHRPAAGLDVERAGWIDHQQHGNRAQHQRQGRCLCVGNHATDPRHLQLLRAVNWRLNKR